MGKNRSHARPPRMPEMPKMNIQATLFPASSSFFIHKPHKTPPRAVATAGMVLQIPSGSPVLDDFHTWVVVSRSEERRVGTDCASTCRSPWPPNHTQHTTPPTTPPPHTPPP